MLKGTRAQETFAVISNHVNSHDSIGPGLFFMKVNFSFIKDHPGLRGEVGGRRRGLLSTQSLSSSQDSALDITLRPPTRLAAHLPYTEMAPRMTQADHSGRYLMNTKAMSALIMMR